MLGKQELHSELQAGSDPKQLQPLWMWHPGPGHHLVVLEMALQGSFVRVPAPDDALSEFHICCIKLETRQMHK